MKHLNRVKDLKQLIHVGLKDLGLIIEDDNYTLNVTEWHEPLIEGDGTCSVCVAGAVIAKTLEGDIDYALTPGMFDQQTYLKLNLLNCIRTGEISDINWTLRDLKWPELTTEQERVINAIELREADLEAWQELAKCI